jgi:hypothetical protein
MTYPREIDCTGRNVDVHQVVYDTTLNVTLVLMHHHFLTCMQQTARWLTVSNDIQNMDTAFESTDSEIMNYGLLHTQYIQKLYSTICSN